MYTIVLTIHSLLRWIVLVLAALAVVRAFIGWFGTKEWTALDRRLGVFLSSSVDLQLLVGLILYFFLSPTTRPVFQNLGAALSNEVVRYWTLEHVPLMIAALVLIHAGSALSRRGGEATARHRRAAIFFGLAILLILFAIPWPFFSYGRPLIRWG